LSPLLSLSSCLQLLLGLVSSSAPPLKALEFYCSEKTAQACGYQRVCQETQGVSFRKFDFGSRSHLVRTSLKLQPVKTQPREVLERLCNGLLLGLLLLLLLLVLLLLN